MAEVKTFDAFVEIPRGSRVKYEYDFDAKRVRFDRLLHSSMMYPGDYGFFPETVALDKDPLDVIILGANPIVPLCLVEVKPVAVLHMSDDKGDDEKIICVPVTDPIWNKYNDINDLNPHLLDEIKHFFQVYKDLEGKECDVREWGNAKEAYQLIDECVKRYNESDLKAKGAFTV